MSRPCSRSRSSRRLLGAAAAAVVLVLLLGGGAAAQQEIPVTLKAQYFRYDPATKILVAEGDVVITYQNVTIRAQRLTADLGSGLVRATGDVRIEVSGQVVSGEALEFNLFTRFATLFNAASDIRGELIVGEVRVRAERVEGIADEFLSIRTAQATTCELPNPDYLITAREITYFVGDRIVFRDVSLWIAGRRIYTVPFFVVFLRERRPARPLPLIGYNDFEGFFVKTVANYVVDNTNYGFIYLDMMSRLGAGIGVEHLYTRGRAAGSVLAYSLRNFRTQGYDTRTRVVHTQPLFGGQVRLYVDRLTSQGRLISPLRSTFASADGAWSSANSNTIAYVQHSTTEGILWSASESVRLLHSRRLTPALSLDAFVDAFQFRQQATRPDREVFPRLALRYTHPRALITGTVEARLDPDNNLQDFRYSLERLPEVTAAFNPIRLGPSLLLTAQVGAGYFRETVPVFTGPPEIARAIRVDATATITGVLPFGPRTNLFVYSFGRAAVYSTRDLLFLLGGRLDLNHQFTDTLGGRAGYTFRTTRGASPFLFDQALGTASFLDLALTYRRDNLFLTATTYYDFISRTPGDIVAQAQYLRGDTLAVVLAASYSLQFGQLSRIEALVDWQVSERWRIQYQGAFLPPSRSLFNDRISVIYTKQCWAAALTYRGTLNQIWLEAWITAFPWARSVVGFGPQGPLFDQPYFQNPQGGPNGGGEAYRGGGSCGGSRS